jgi:hypothetical protein
MTPRFWCQEFSEYHYTFTTKMLSSTSDMFSFVILVTIKEKPVPVGAKGVDSGLIRDNSSNDFIQRRLCPRFNLLSRLILNRVRYVDRVKVRAGKRRGLRAGCRLKLIRSDGDCRNS